MNGFKLAVIYSFGEKLSQSFFNFFLKSKKEKILENSKFLFPYLKLIAQSNKISNNFQKQVVEAYWLGNRLLENVKPKELRNLIRKEFNKKTNFSINLLACHNFHTLFVESLPKRIKELCRISWGKVIKIYKSKVLVEYQPIVFKEGATYLGELKKKWIKWNKKIVPKLKIGHHVSFHWNFLCQILTRKQLENLNYYTRKILYSFNPKISPVVHVFLKYKDKILILKRSDLLFTYPKRWSVVAGYLEKGDDLLERAIKEVEEETKIKKQNLRLLKKGKSYRVKDKSINKTWIIHPFLFETKTNKVKIDWEHTTFRWIKPKEIKRYKTIPQLEKGLRFLIKV